MAQAVGVRRIPGLDEPTRQRLSAPGLAALEHRDGQLSVKATNVRERSVTPAEVAQAQLFEDILQAEVAELEQLACQRAGSLDRQPELDGLEVAVDLRRIHERLEEVNRLLYALHRRFSPTPRWDHTPE
jgi:hypothetical protein